ncbi:unnamed protein product, partial [Didymodactylos carnosus]
LPRTLPTIYSLEQLKQVNNLKNHSNNDTRQCNNRPQIALANNTHHASERKKNNMSKHNESPVTSTENNIPNEQQLKYENDNILQNISLDISSDLSEEKDVTIRKENVDKSLSRSTVSSFNSCISPQDVTLLPRTNSSKSVSSTDSYRSALPPNSLLAVDSSSYASVNDRSLSSYYTATDGGSSSTSSITGYDTPTPQIEDDDESSVQSSTSDLSHAETLELDENAKSTDLYDSEKFEESTNAETAINKSEQTNNNVVQIISPLVVNNLQNISEKKEKKTMIALSDSQLSNSQRRLGGGIEMEISPDGDRNSLSSSSTDSSSHFSQQNDHWYEGNSIATCIHRQNSINNNNTTLVASSSLPNNFSKHLSSDSLKRHSAGIYQTSTSGLREIPNDEILREVDLNDINNVGDEFFLFSPRNENEDDNSSKEVNISAIPNVNNNNNSMHNQNNRLYAFIPSDDDNKNNNNHEDLFPTDTNESDFHYSTTRDPFGFGCTTITNLDDIIDDNHDVTMIKNYRRPLQEDILYEVENENSHSDHSPNTTSVIALDDAYPQTGTDEKLWNGSHITASDQPVDVLNDNTIKSTFDFTEIIDNSKVDDTAKSINVDEQKSKKSAENILITPKSPVQELEEMTSSKNDNILPIYIAYSLPPLFSTQAPTALSVDTSTTTNNSLKPSYLLPSMMESPQYCNLKKWDSLINNIDELSSTSSPSSYTSKIRHRQYSVGSYYDHKSTTTATHHHHTCLLGSAPVSPIGRNDILNTFVVRHSPVSLGSAALSALRRMNPFMETSASQIPTISLYQPIIINNRNIHSDPSKTVGDNDVLNLSSDKIQNESNTSDSIVTDIVTKDDEAEHHDLHNHIDNKTQKVEKEIIESVTQNTYDVPSLLPDRSSFRSSNQFQQYEVPQVPHKQLNLNEMDEPHIYQEIRPMYEEQLQKQNGNHEDFQFIRGAIERVFDFHTASNDSEASDATPYEHISDDSVSSSETKSSQYKTTISKNNDKSSDIKHNKSISEENAPFPAVEAVQRFYRNNNNYNNTVYVNSETIAKKLIPVTNLDDNFEYLNEPMLIAPTNNDKNSPSHVTHKNTIDVSKRFDLSKINEEGISATKSKSKSKSSAGAVEQEINNSEVDDTLNDIEDYLDQGNKESSHTSNENSPVTSTQHAVVPKTIKPAQETQTEKFNFDSHVKATSSPTESQSTIHSYQTAKSSLPVDIVTTVILEKEGDDDDDNDVDIEMIEGDMVLYYDDIEIVEHSPISSTSASSSEDVIPQPPPPVPARTLKPMRLLNDVNDETRIVSQRKASIETDIDNYIESRNITNNLTYGHIQSNNVIEVIPSKTTKTSIRIVDETKIPPLPPRRSSSDLRKFGVNMVNDLLNRTDYKKDFYVTSIQPYPRIPSSRHYCGKINENYNNSSSRTSSGSSGAAVETSRNLKKQVLPLEPIIKSRTLPATIGDQQVNNTANIIDRLSTQLSQSPTSSRLPPKSPFATLPSRTTNPHPSIKQQQVTRQTLSTNALTKQIQNAVSKSSLYGSQTVNNLSTSTKELRDYVSDTYTPDESNIIDDNEIVHVRNDGSDQLFKRQQRLSRSFHNVSDYHDAHTTRTLPSKSYEDNLDHVADRLPLPQQHSQLKTTLSQSRLSPTVPLVPSTSTQEDNARMLSMKWYTGQVSENSEICYMNKNNDDLLKGYITAHGTREMNNLFDKLHNSTDVRIQAALDDIRLRVVQFDQSKSQNDLQAFMLYLESRLKDLSRISVIPRDINGDDNRAKRTQSQTSLRTSSSNENIIDNNQSNSNEKNKQPSRQLGRQQMRPTTNGHSNTQKRRPSTNRDKEEDLDNVLNTILALPKKGETTLSRETINKSINRDGSTPLPVSITNKDQIGKRLFESAFTDQRLLYDGPKKKEELFETSV